LDFDTVDSKVWVWPVEEMNWPTVKEKQVWAVGKKGKGSRVKQGDKIIFFLKGRGFFVGIFSVDSDWHERTIVWPEQKHGSDVLSIGAEIDLGIIQLGFADWGKLLYDLKFVEKKSPKLRGLSLRGTVQGPANSARPISQEDYDLILKEMIKVQKEPIVSQIVDEEEIVDLIDISEHEFELDKLPDPIKKTVEDIFKDVENGRYAIPKFQRYWTWERKQIEELWESIFRSYYIGSLLYWETREEKLGTTPIEGAPMTIKNADYVLDGQQRITAIYYAIKAPQIGLPNTTKPYVFFLNINALLDSRIHSSELVDSFSNDDAQKKNYFEEKTQFARKIFPLSELKNNGGLDWLFSFQNYLQSEQKFSREEAEIVFKKLNMFFSYVWSKYEIPVVKLSETISNENVIKVFERINSRGTPLDVFDLLNARFALYQIVLKDEWEKVRNSNINLKKWTEESVSKNKDKIPIYILQSISLVKKGYLRRSQILTIDEVYKISGTFENDEFLNDWNEMASFVDEALKRLTDTRYGFGAINYNLIPYTVMIPIIAALLKTIAGRDDKTNCMDKISLWYWNTIRGDNYSGSTDSKGELDYKKMVDWFDNSDEQPFNNIEGDDFNTSKKSSAIYKGIMCLIAKKGALDFVENDSPDYSKLEDHHIFPGSKSEKYGAKGTEINSILNRTLIFEKTNRWINNKDPSDYLLEIMEKQNIDENEMRRRLETHLISSEAFDCMLKNDFNGFIESRMTTVIEEMNKMSGKKMSEIPSQITPGKNFDNMLIPRNAVRKLNYEIFWVSKYFSESDLETLRLGMNDDIKKIHILSSKKRKDVKSEFKRFKEQFSDIECQMKIMSKNVESEIHGRYLADKEKCYNMIDTEIAKRGQTDDISLCNRPENLEKWWNDSFDIFDEWNKFQD